MAAENPPAASAFLHFDGMCWPNPDDPNETQWRLRYGTPTRADLLFAAHVMCAYGQLVEDSQQVRNAKVAGLRRTKEAVRVAT
jgi:hypothetical protein